MRMYSSRKKISLLYSSIVLLLTTITSTSIYVASESLVEQNNNSSQIMRTESVVKGNSNIPKIIHISDIHIGASYCQSPGINCKTSLNNLRQKLVDWHQPNKSSDYVIVITGDVIDRILPNENYKNLLLAKQFVQELEKHFRRVLVIPGNHDLKTKKKYLISKKSETAFKKIMYGEALAQKRFPKIDIVDGIAFIGLNSMESAIGTLYSKNYNQLHIGVEQQKLLEDILEHKEKYQLENKKVVLYFHHPVEYSDAEDAQQQRFIKMIERYKKANQIAAILTGHNHNSSPAMDWSGVLEHNAGTSTGKKRAKSSPIYIIDLEFFSIQTITEIPRD